VREADRPVLVFADARQRFAPDAIRRLVAHFQDPAVGAVSGELIIEGADLKVGPYRNGPADNSVGAGLQTGPSTVADGVGLYWAYEKWLRRREAIVGSTLGVTGAIYAMRRLLWRPLPPDTLLDDVLGPMRVVLRGYRVVFEGGARAYDCPAADASAEFRRKVRTLAGNFQLLAQEPRLLLPVVNPVWLQFMSHKIGRLFVPYALVGAFAASAALAPASWLYTAALAAQAGFYGLAIYGGVLERRQRTAGTRPNEVMYDAA
jgi:cellulose synthase/poly-beta-1,6-N-acetylglucosamine synthase-like glycosyltransferase